MADPISPIGGPGQIPSLNPVSTAAGSVSAQTAAPEVVGGQPDATRQGMDRLGAGLKARAETAPMTIDEAVKAFRQFLENLPSDLQFVPDQESGYVIFKVVNPITKEVIRQYPPDEVVRMARNLKAAAQQGRSGIFLDKKL